MSDSDLKTVADVMSTPLETISKTATLEAATQKMQSENIKALVVPSDPRGIISSTDILDAIADGHDVSSVTVETVMTEDVETVTPDLYMEEVAAMMTTYGINHLPVVDDDYVGMISSTDVTATIS